MLTDLSDINTIAFYITLLSIASVVVLTVLLLRAGKGYSVKDSQSHAEGFAGGMKEGHGGLTAFFGVLVLVILFWTVVYFVIHAGEFAVLFSP